MSHMNKDTTIKKIETLYKDKRNWTPPSMGILAKRLGVSKSLVFHYIKILRTQGKI